LQCGHVPMEMGWRPNSMPLTGSAEVATSTMGTAVAIGGDEAAVDSTFW
jgi:hypothetical protein